MPNLDVTARTVFSHTIPATAYRGFGAPQYLWALESQMDKAARRLGLDRLDIRLRNLPPKGGVLIPGDTPVDGEWAQGLRMAAEAIGWREPLPAHRGRGVAIGIKTARSAATSQAIVRLHHDGSASVMAGTSEMGQGSQTVFAQIAAQSLGIPYEKVKVVIGDTGRAPFDAVTASSRSTVSMGNAIVAACDDIRRKLAALAAEVQGVTPEDVEVSDGQVRSPAGCMTYGDVVGACYGRGEGEVIGVGEFRLPRDADHPLGGPAPFWEIIFVAAEVEVDEETGRYTVTKLATAADVGKAINPAQVKGQDEGGALMSVGQAQMEQLILDERGVPRNMGALDYRIPTTMDVPLESESLLVENADGPGPFGAKGVGESGAIAVAPAICSAVSEATGASFTELPITAERVWRALQERTMPARTNYDTHAQESTMSFTLRSIAVSTVPMRTRMPFRYGIAKLEALPHVFVKVALESSPDGKLVEGVCAEGLLPKWFEKNPETSGQQDLENMHKVIVHAGELALAAGPFDSAFRFWKDLYDAQAKWAAGEGLAPLIWHFGVTMVERAVIDALCRYWRVPFQTAPWRRTASASRSPRSIRTSARPRRRRCSSGARSNPSTCATPVGLSDAILPEEVEEPLNDGLPESMLDDIRAYGLTYYKIKVRGDVDVDVARLRSIAEVFRSLGVEGYRFTLDGNETFYDVDTFRTFWDRIRSDAALSAFFKRLIFIEQPFTRKIALSHELGRDLKSWQDAPPMIIDESDGSLEDVPTALSHGYCGTSHKNCKGVFKGIVNAVYIHDANKRAGKDRYFMSGEDLVNIGPVALLQDLTLMGVLNISHVERNGHHYFRGLSMFSDALQEEMLKHHGDLYHRHPDGYAALNIVKGRVDIHSLIRAPFGVAFIPHESEYVPLAEWPCPTVPGA